MIKYPAELSEALALDEGYIEKNGLKILVKSIPDEPRPGRLDPREKRLLLKVMKAGGGAGITPSGLMPISEVREVMGFPNLNLNTREIYTRYLERDFGGNTVKIWVYYPRRPLGKTDRPGIVYLHGGGFIGGSAFAVENQCRFLAQLGDCVVFNVEYSLAPEKPYPNALNDAWHTLEYVHRNAGDFGVDSGKLAIGGDSAGGNLAAAVSMRDRDMGTGYLKYQTLIYPLVTFAEGYDWSMGEYEIDPEEREYITVKIEPDAQKDSDRGQSTFAKLYLRGNHDLEDPYISPLLGEKKGLCKAFIATAEFDWLRVQGEAYAEALEKAGVPVRVVRYRGVGHTYIDKLGYLPQAEDTIREIAKDMQEL